MFNLNRPLKLATAGVLIAALSLAIAAPASAADRRGRDRGDRQGHYERNDAGRDWNRRGKHYGNTHKSPKIIGRPYADFTHYKPYSGLYGSRYAPRRSYGYNNWNFRRRYGRHYSGFGFNYSGHNALRFLGLTALGLVIFNELSEAQQRAHENALARATTAHVGDRITWNQSGLSGNVVVTREGRTTDDRLCREFQQEVNISGERKQAYGTACMQPDGAWKIVNN